jgi:lipopolysaccharide biosynthesis protein
MIHGFYPDVLDDILLKLPSFCAGTVGTQLDLYVSTSMDQIDQVEKKLRDLDFACVRLFGVENRGRDVAPFLLHLLPAVAAAGHHFFVKLHTKKSLQFGIDGLDKWSRHLIESLLSAAGLEAIRYQFLNAKDLGCLCPSGTLLPLAIALFKNKTHLHYLLSHSEINGRWALMQTFVAGSMFAGRVEAFRSLLDQGFSLDDFELEGGQFDGTLAHALERLISLEVKRSGWQIKEMSGNPGAVPGFGYGLVD